MVHDNNLNIATGLGARSKVWKNTKILWSDFVKRIETPHKTTETLKEFLAASKLDQSKIKDVGGYVGGYLRNGKRNPENVVHRQLVTLDIDFAHLDFWDDFCMQFNNAAILHGTHKHSDADPRYRLLLPLNREVTSDEYVAISRSIAGTLGIDLFDNTTFEVNRLMFWPSSPKDVEYYCKVQDGPWIDADEVLNSYIDWKDTSLWPTAAKDFASLVGNGKKQEDPETKKGIVGSFCRTYGIAEAIETFLTEEYTYAMEDRYTYTKGSTAAGLIVYENKYAYSHHGTDPCSGKLSNAFDLVRLHLYGHLDPEGESTGIPKSYKAMEALALKDANVKKTIAKEFISTVKYDFSEPIEQDEQTQEEAVDWLAELEIDAKGNYLSTATNINLILANDIRLKAAFKYNEFDAKRYVFKSLPWRRVETPEPVKNVDYSGVRNYIESIYGISGTLKIDDSLALEIEKNTYHPVRDYLNSLQWDGVKRLDTLLVEYFGAEDNVYSREAIRKMLVAAVARVFRPGCKFDLVLTLVGDQGSNKSTFIKKLGKEWFSDTFMTVQGKEALEQIQGAWLIEMAELSGLRKAEVEAIKHFISKQEDSFRPAYARTSETFMRQCVFFGTTNKKDFLTDPSGNRRFIPIDVNRYNVSKSVWDDLDQEVDLIWSEAVELFKQGEPLYLSAEAEAIARVEQLKHSEVDDRKGLIEQFLDRPILANWDSLDVDSRRLHYSQHEVDGTVQRDFVCMAEIWCECLGKNKEDMSRYNTREINDILKGLQDWEYHTSTKNFAIYGKQKYYSRKLL
jgi:predicted P-loop ATPase